MADSKSFKLPLWVTIFVVLCAVQAFVIGYMGMFNLEALSGHAPSPESQHHANFMAVRQFVLSLALIGLLFVREYRALGFLLIVMGFIQVGDASLNILDGELAGETFAMVTLAVLDFLTARKLLSLTKK